MQTTMALASAPAPAVPVIAGSYGALPTDVLQDILLRLPADEVCRLRLVCRSWRSMTSDPLFAAAHASCHPHVVVVVLLDEVPEVLIVDLHGDVVKRRWIRTGGPVSLGSLTMHRDLLCVAHGWGLACVVDVVTGTVVADVDVAAEQQRKLDVMRPQCVFGHVPSTGEYKVLRVHERRQTVTCEVMTLGGGAGAGRWRPTPRPPVAIRIESCNSRNMAVVDGLAYFLVDDHNVQETDWIAVFDLEMEQWKPATIRGPLSSKLLRKARFLLARLGESLVVVYCNFQDTSTELWFLEDMDHTSSLAAPRWSRRYTLQCTPFRKKGDRFMYCDWLCFGPLQYHYPLAVLDDGRILVWVDIVRALKAYDPETSAWTDLAKLPGCSVAGLHRGSLLCSNLGAVQA